MTAASRTIRFDIFEIPTRRSENTIGISRKRKPFFQALKLNVPLSLIGAIVGEFFSSLGGLGFYMTFALDRFDAPVAWAIMAIAGAAGVLLYLLVSLIERVAIPWHSSVGGARR